MVGIELGNTIRKETTKIGVVQVNLWVLKGKIGSLESLHIHTYRYPFALCYGKNKYVIKGMNGDNER